MILRHCSIRRMVTLANHKPILYGDDASPPVRFVKMTASILGIDLECHEIDLFKRENRTEFYKTMVNPLQKVPAMKTNANIICDSHAIAIYLCQTVAGQSLYPEDSILKARVNEMLFYNASLLFPIDSSILTDFFAGKNDFSEKYEEWNSALDYLDKKLQDTKWLAGNEMTLCDLCVVSTVSSMQQLEPLTARHLRVTQWQKELEQLNCYEINKIGLQRLGQFIKLVNLNKKN